MLRGMPRFFRMKVLLKQQGVLLGLIAVITAAFFAQVAFGWLAYYDFMVVPGAVTEAWGMLREGGFSEDSARAFGSLLSSAFLHGDFQHLLFNMLYLWIFAALAAELLGQRWVLFVFGFTAICGSICHVALNPDEMVPMLGASGAVMGFEGLYLGMALRWKLPDPHVWPMSRPIPPGQLAAIGVIGLVLDFMNFMDGHVGVAYGAHLGGFVGGVLMASTIVPKPLPGRGR